MRLKKHELPLLALIASAIGAVWLIYWIDTGKWVTAGQLIALPRIFDGCLVGGFFVLWRMFAASDSDDGLLENRDMRDGALCGLIAGLAIFQMAGLTSHPIVISYVILTLVVAGAVAFFFLDAMGMRLTPTSAAGHSPRAAGQITQNKDLNDSLFPISGLVPGCWLALGLTFGAVAGYAVFPIFLLVIFVITVVKSGETYM